MRSPIVPSQKIRDVFQKRKVLTKQQLVEVGGCSNSTMFRCLRQLGYYSSYNDNARHYTLEGIPRFNEHGLWRHCHAFFSKWGTLTETIVALVQQSDAGLTADQLHQLLHLGNLRPLLTRLIEQQTLARVKMDGRFVYLSAAESAAQTQQQRRTQQIQEERIGEPLPSLEQTVALLVAIIRKPRNTPRQWARRLAQQGIRLGASGALRVLDHYHIDLQAVKEPGGVWKS